MTELEGQCLGKHGYVISILDVDDAEIFPGLIDNDSGAVSVTVFYSAILLRYFHLSHLPLTIYHVSPSPNFIPYPFHNPISRAHDRPFRNEVMDTVVITATDENGFFTRAGPLQIFVSRHAMPEDMKFNHNSGITHPLNSHISYILRYTILFNHTSGYTHTLNSCLSYTI